jgi:myo-inositol-1(or 4)-monophosphatase
MKKIFAFEDFNDLESALVEARTNLRRLWATDIVGLASQDRSPTRWRGEGRTPIDIRCENIIVEAIDRKCANLSIFSEDGGHVRQGTESAASCIIDPLDGTHNAYGGYPAFSASVALHDGQKYVFGWVYDLSRDVSFTAASGRGAFMHTDISAARIFAGPGCDLEDAAISLMRARNSPYQATSMRLFERAGKIRISSCSSLDLCLIASGSLSGFVDLSDPGHQRSCDIAAGALILEEAGGMLLNREGAQRVILAPSHPALSDRAPLIACDSKKTADSIFDFINA